MAEKILNINDFKKDEAGIDNKAGVPSKTAPLRTPYVRPDEMNPDDIQIEDPMNFLTSEEKQEYIKAHQETILRNRAVNEVRREVNNQRNAQYQRKQAINQGSYSQDQRFSYPNGYQNGGQSGYNGTGYSGRPSDNYDESYDDNYQDEYYEDYQGSYEDGYDNGGYYEGDQDYNDGYQVSQQGYDQGYEDQMYQDRADYEEYEEDMEGGQDKMAVITKILAGFTAILIIVIAIMFIFNKVNDPANEKEAGDEFAYTGDNTVAEESQGQSETNTQETVSGTTVYTTNGLNLRTSPEKTDTNKAMSVQAGTELTLVGEENGWAKVYYQGQYYFCSKDYLSETK